jgi:DNA polymerase-3 subunit gamma/tau
MPVEVLLGDGAGSRPGSAPASTGSTSSSTGASTPAAGSAVEPDEEIDLDGLTDAPPESYRTPEQEVADVFPGSRMLEVED